MDKLPRELRDMIYKLAVVGDTHLVPVDSLAIFGPPIVRTCSAARKVGLQEFYSSHSLEIEIKCAAPGTTNFSNLRKWLARVGPNELSLVRRAHIVILPHMH